MDFHEWHKKHHSVSAGKTLYTFFFAGICWFALLELCLYYSSFIFINRILYYCYLDNNVVFVILVINIYAFFLSKTQQSLSSKNSGVEHVPVSTPPWIRQWPRIKSITYGKYWNFNCCPNVVVWRRRIVCEPHLFTSWWCISLSASPHQTTYIYIYI